MNVVILDTGCANLNSVKSAIARHGYDPLVSRDPDVVLHASKLFLPGVGTAQAAMDQIHQRELVELIKACTQPVLGICLGMQLLGRRSEESNGVDLLGIIDEDVPKMTDHGLPLPHMGWNRVYPKAGDRLFRGIEDGAYFYFVHSYAMPVNANTIAQCQYGEAFTAAVQKDNFYGVQFHPEVTHTRQGMRMLDRFIRDICQCEALWTPAKIIDDAVERIRQQVGDDKVILGLSGGVDSSVTAMLLHRAIGKNLTCVFVDNGLLRLNEAQQVMDMFGDHFGLNIVHVEGEKRFLDALAGENDPEAKRKIIGRVFVEVFDEEALKLEDVKWLAQGTIYPDVIESAASATGKAHVIKSHHNVGGLPKEMKMGLVEPLRELFKDEVRKIGLELGLPYDMLYRHPFPGPGLGVRVLGEVKKEYCDLLRRADAIFIEELHKADLYNKVSQAFTVFLPVRSVGVMGDGRKYDWVVSLRAVETIDFMTAHWAHLPYDFLGRVSNRIINEVNGISRVVYDISGKPPATIEWE